MICPAYFLSNDLSYYRYFRYFKENFAKIRHTVLIFLVVIGVISYAVVFSFGRHEIHSVLENATESSTVKSSLLACVTCGLPLMFDGLLDLFSVKTSLENSYDRIEKVLLSVGLVVPPLLFLVLTVRSEFNGRSSLLY